MLQARVLLEFSLLSSWSVASEGELLIGEFASKFSFSLLHVAGELQGSALGGKKKFASLLQLPLVGPEN